MSEPKMERTFLVPGTLDAIRVTCEVDSAGTDTSSVSLTCHRPAGAVTTGRLIASDDRRLCEACRGVCVAGSPAGERHAAQTLLNHVEAWYGEHVGQMLLRALAAFVASPILMRSECDPSGDSGG